MDHDELGRLIVRLAVDQVIAVGDTVRTVRALHQGAVMEGSWGDEAELVASVEQAVARLRNAGDDGPRRATSCWWPEANSAMRC